MTDSEKLWVIDLGEEVTAAPPPQKPRETPRPRMASVATARPVVPKVAPLAPPPAPRQLHFALRLTLTYLLGPFALLLWSRGRGNAFWTVTSVFSGLGTLALAWQWPQLLALGSSGSLLIPLLTGAGLIAVLAFSAWARAVHLAFAAQTRSHTSLPVWMRTGWAVTGLGLLVPGFGLYLAGKRGRAVATLWSFWPVFLAALVLANAAATWRWLQGSLHTPGQLEMFEYLVAAAAAVLVVGYLGWLAQALAGLHLKARLAGATAGTHGDRYALALLAAVVALVVFTSPADVASLLHETGMELYQEGFQVLPLQLARTAHSLDPEDAAYFGTLASLERRRLDAGESAGSRGRLAGDDQVYYGMLARRPAVAPPAALPQQEKAAAPESVPVGDPAWSRPLDLTGPLTSPDKPGPM